MTEDNGWGITDYLCCLRCCAMRQTNNSANCSPDFDSLARNYRIYRHEGPFNLAQNKGVLPRLEIAYETWGELNKEKSNAVLVCGGYTSSSHATSSEANPSPGWYDTFIGPGRVLDTDRLYVLCHNYLGSCYGTTGPRSVDDRTGKPYGTKFPVFTTEDMSNAVFLLLEHLGIDKLHAAIGMSIGGMLTLHMAALRSDRIGRMISIAANARNPPGSIASRYLQRTAIMDDPNWSNGDYYGKTFPFNGVKLARSIGMTTFRSEEEWCMRFGRDLTDTSPRHAVGPSFQVESYLQHCGEKCAQVFDANSYLYMIKAMDLFDISQGHESLASGLTSVRCPVMVIGIQNDTLCPIWQQRELANTLQEAGNERVSFFTVESPFGHDAFSLDRGSIGGLIKGFLESENTECGCASKADFKYPRNPWR